MRRAVEWVREQLQGDASPEAERLRTVIAVAEARLNPMFTRDQIAAMEAMLPSAEVTTEDLRKVQLEPLPDDEVRDLLARDLAN